MKNPKPKRKKNKNAEKEKLKEEMVKEPVTELEIVSNASAVEVEEVPVAKVKKAVPGSEFFSTNEFKLTLALVVIIGGLALLYSTDWLPNGTGLQDNSFNAGAPDEQQPLPELPNVMARCSANGYFTERGSDGLQALTRESRTKLMQEIDKVGNLALNDIAGLTCLENFFLRDENLIRDEKISDISALAQLPNLKKLGIHSFYLRNISTVAGMAKLEELDVSYSSVGDISPATRLKKLRKINLELNSITNVYDLREMTWLKELYLGATNVSDIQALRNLASLERLSLFQTQLEDLSPIGGMANLKSLSINDTYVTDISPLRNNLHLQDLNIFVTKISDISVLAQLQELKNLNMKQSKVSNITPLLGLSGLVTLDVSSSYVSQQDCKKLEKALPNTKINC